MEGRIEVAGRREGRCKQLLNDLRSETGYFKLKKEALYRRLWRSRFARNHGHVARQTTVWTTAPTEFPVLHIRCGFWRIFPLTPSYGEKFSILLLKVPSILDCGWMLHYSIRRGSRWHISRVQMCAFRRCGRVSNWGVVPYGTLL